MVLIVPRPKRLHGRPGTRVVPKDFERDHARAVSGSRTARCTITAPATGEPQFDAALGYSVRPPGGQLYAGSVRVQVVGGEARSRIVGEQDQKTRVYRLAVDDDCVVIPSGATVTFSETGTTDAWLAATTLFVHDGDLGSIRFERHLLCVDDVTALGRTAP